MTKTSNSGSSDPSLLPIKQKDSAKLDIVQTLIQIQEYYSAGQLRQAQRLCKDILLVDPFNEMALRELGIISHRLQEWTYARDCFLRLTGLKTGSRDEAVFYNLGHTCIMLNDIDLAFAAFSKTIELNPGHASAHNSLGVLLEKRGDYEDAIDYFYDACELDPQHVLSRIHLISMLSHLHRYDECNDMIEDSLSINTMTPDQRGGLLIQHAVNAWITNNLKVCKRALRLCKHVLPHMKSSDDTESLLRQLITLLEYRSLHPEVYSGEYDREIYFVGDEQSLYSADTLLRIKELDYKVVPYYLTKGCAANIAAANMNPTRAGFEVAIEQIPSKSQVLIGFGLEDSRPEADLFDQIRNSSDDMSEVIENLVETFVERVIVRCKNQDLNPIFVGISASDEDLRDFSVEDQMQYFKMLEILNQGLSASTQARGAGFVDIYAATIGENGRSTQQYRLNNQHLTPSALPEIIEHYLLTPVPEVKLTTK